MKKIVKLFFAGALSAMAFGAHAQSFEKGDWFLNANASDLNLSFSNGRNIDSLSRTNFNVAALAGYFISDKFAVDAGLGLDYSNVENYGGTSHFQFLAGVRYYPVNNIFARVSYGGTVHNYAGFSAELSSSLQMAIGYDWFISDKVFFEPTVLYTRGLERHTINSNPISLSLGIGVKF
jgi:opacity protein-like surface antigen